MTIRLYLDEDSMRQALVQALRARGVDVITANSTEEMRNQVEFLSAWDRCQSDNHE